MAGFWPSPRHASPWPSLELGGLMSVDCRLAMPAFWLCLACSSALLWASRGSCATEAKQRQRLTTGGCAEARRGQSVGRLAGSVLHIAGLLQYCTALPSRAEELHARLWSRAPAADSPRTSFIYLNLPFPAAILAYGAGGLGAVKRALPSAEYGHIKLAAVLMDCQVRMSSCAHEVIPHAASSSMQQLPCSNYH